MNGGEPRLRFSLPRWGGLGALARLGKGARASWPADLLVAAALFGLLSLIVHMATAGARAGAAPAISLSLRALPLYAVYSVARMAAAYALSLVFALAYGYAAASDRRAERVLIPILDVLQSVPILSFMPAVVLALTGLFPGSSLGAELASVLLVFTSQAWNLAFSFYNSLLTVPPELREVARMYRLGWWQRFRHLDLPYATVGLVWNSMMSWAGGWFFLMAAEMFTLGSRSFQVPGLGSYLATSAGHPRAEVAGLTMLVLVIVAIDQLLWRPLIAWADKFKVELLSNQTPPRSSVLMLLRRSQLVDWANRRFLTPWSEALDRLLAPQAEPAGRAHSGGWARRAAGVLAGVAVALVISLAAWRGVALLLGTPAGALGRLPLAALWTCLRVAATLALSTLWTVPVGVFIGLNRVWASRLQPLVQILASVPASALFPLIVLWVGGGLGWLSILLMLLGAQWYVLFNVIAGAMALPEDLKEATALFGLSRLDTWRVFIIPGILPSLITGLITAAGGSWNAAIVTEYVRVGQNVVHTVGLGATIAEASARGSYGLLLGATLTLSALVVLINRLVWRPLYRTAELRYTLLP